MYTGIVFADVVSIGMTNPLYGIFGGTFDPLHNGHLAIMTAVFDKCALEQVRLVPAAAPPHRDPPNASAQQRLEMVSLAIANYPQFDVDDRELKRETPSYTYDTVKSLQNENAARRYCLILGVDALSGLAGWHRWQELLASIHFIVVQRPGWALPQPLPDWWQQARAEVIDELTQFEAGKICLVDVEPNSVSATKIRDGIAQGVDVSTMVPHSVWDYICTNKLYGA